MTPVKRLELAEERQAKQEKISDPPFVVLLPRLQTEGAWLSEAEDSPGRLAVGRYFSLVSADRAIPERLQRAADLVLVSAWRSAAP